MTRTSLTLTLLCLLTGLHSPAAVIDDFAPTTNDRFANATDFIGRGLDWSGVGMTSSGRWATLIGPNTVISANHFPPSGVISFFPGNDSTAPAIELSVTDGFRLGQTDLWLGCLNQQAPDSIRSYPHTTETLTVSNFADSILHEVSAFMLGRSPSLFPTVLDQSIGRNTIDDFVENTRANLGANVDTLRLVYDAATSAGNVDNPAYGSHETYLQVGDSGAPLFLEQDGELLLLGVNSFVVTGGANSSVTESHASYVGNESDEVESTIQFCLSTVPEPGSGLLWLVGASLMARSWRKR